MSTPLRQLCDWLVTTPLSQVVQGTSWAIPAIQTLHILAIAVAVSSAFMIDLRLIGILAPARPLASVSARFLPPLWVAVGALATSGAVLIVAEPNRTLLNRVFGVKMLLLILAIAATLVIGRALRRDSEFWDRSTARRAAAASLAVVSMLLWSGIVCAGRWIAYLA